MNSDSDGVSILSATNSAMSTSNSSAMGTSLPHGSTRMVSRPSPVREGRNSEEKYSEAIPERPEESAPIESFFEMVTPLPKQPRAGRKVGHATLRADSAVELAEALRRVGAALGREAQVAPVIARLL